jgi:AcrR family transcriptional regulator
MKSAAQATTAPTHSAVPTRASAGPAENSDGRRAWRDRNLSAVVDALLDLFAEGNLRPGADEIASRSGVSRRSVFRYFDDLDSLDRVAIERQIARVSHLIELKDTGVGTVAARIDRLIAQRLRLFEAILPVARVSRLRAPFEPVVSAELARSRRLFRRQVELHFGDVLAGFARSERNATVSAADALCSFEAYELMRLGHVQSPKQIGEAMRIGLSSLLGVARSTGRR